MWREKKEKREGGGEGGGGEEGKEEEKEKNRRRKTKKKRRRRGRRRRRRRGFRCQIKQPKNNYLFPIIRGGVLIQGGFGMEWGVGVNLWKSIC